MVLADVGGAHAHEGSGKRKRPGDAAGVGAPPQQLRWKISALMVAAHS